MSNIIPELKFKKKTLQNNLKTVQLLIDGKYRMTKGKRKKNIEELDFLVLKVTPQVLQFKSQS